MVPVFLAIKMFLNFRVLKLTFYVKFKIALEKENTSAILLIWKQNIELNIKPTIWK